MKGGGEVKRGGEAKEKRWVREEEKMIQVEKGG